MAEGETGRLYRLFAGLLVYPGPDLAGLAGEAAGAGAGQAATLLDRFHRCVEQRSPAGMEELYTSTFDLQAVCYPYVGYHLFGDSYKRGMFMARLNGGYRERGFSAEKELPDHVAVILRFLASVSEAERSGAAAPKDGFSRALLDEGLIPAVEKMAEAFGEQSDNPYAGVIRALLLVLRDEGHRATLASPGVAPAGGSDG